MSMELSSLSCCGICEITGMREGRNRLQQFCETYEDETHGYKRFLIFSDNYDNGKNGAITLSKYLSRHPNLGTVVFESERRINPNSKRAIKMFIFEVNDAWIAQIRVNEKACSIYDTAYGYDRVNQSEYEYAYKSLLTKVA